MSRFWMRWLDLWCAAVIAFGALLAVSAVDRLGTSASFLMHALSGGASVVMDAPLRFAVGLMGCVTLGWGFTLLIGFRAAQALGAEGFGVWRALTAGIAGWFALDSLLSIHTGFALNAASNTLFLVAFLIPIMASGVLRGAMRSGTAGGASVV